MAAPIRDESVMKCVGLPPQCERRKTLLLEGLVFFLCPEISPESSRPFHFSGGSQLSLCSLSSLGLGPGASLSWLHLFSFPHTLTLYLQCAGRVVLSVGIPGVEAGSGSSLAQFKLSQGRKILKT